MKYSTKNDDQFFLSKQGKDVGPFTVEVILEKVAAAEHQWTDYVFDPVARDWIVLLEHPLFLPTFEKLFKKPAPPKNNQAAQSEEEILKNKCWFILRDSKNIGPFSKIEIVQMLQLKTLFEYDFIWHKDFHAWKRVSEVQDFQSDEIRKMRTHADVKEIFFRRKHERAEYGCHITLHNNSQIFKGKSIELSEGGAGIILQTPQFSPGDTLYLHFQPGEGVPPFNAICNIVSKSILAEDGKVKYGTKFVHLGPKEQGIIKQFTRSRKQQPRKSA